MMTLHEAIYRVLEEFNRPMTARELADTINSRGIYARRDSHPLTASQITARISNYSRDFDLIQGEIILTKDSAWSEILRSHRYVQNLLRDVTRGDKSSLEVFLFFYKRLSDLSESYSPGFDLPFSSRIRDLGNRVSHASSTFVYDDLKYGIDYLSHRFPQLRSFLEQQYELIKSLNESRLFEIFQILNQFDTGTLENRKFGRIFEYLTQKSCSTNRGEYYFTPQPLADLIGGLSDPQSITEVYDPCAGLGGLLTEIHKQASYDQIGYHASEINPRISALGMVNLIMHGVAKSDYVTADCLTDPFIGKKFNLIVSDLPLIARLEEPIDISFFNKNNLPIPTKRSGTAALILYIISKLNAGGRAFVTVPEGFLFRKGYDETVRKFLLENALIEAVISLPANTLLPFTAVKISILCLSTKGINRVKFINGASELLIRENYSPKQLNVERIIEGYRSSTSEMGFTSVIGVDSVIRNDYILSVDQYNEVYQEANRLLTENNAKHLDALVEVQSGTAKTENDLPEENVKYLVNDSKIKIIRAENLKRDILDLTITPTDITHVINWDPAVDRSVLTQKCLLIARIGENPKPTIFDPSKFDDPIAIHRGVYALVPHADSAVSIEYLYYQFYSPFIQQQLANAQLGATIAHITISNLRKVVVPIVDVSEQTNLVSTQRANLIQLEKEKIEERLKMLGYEKEVADKESDIVRVLVHQLRPTFLSLNSQVEVIMRIVKKNKLEEFREFNDDTLDFSDPELAALGLTPNKPANYSLQDACNKLLKDSRDISDKLTYVNKVMSFNLGKDDFQETEIKTFIKRHVEAVQVNNPLKFRMELSGEECLVEVNRESMSELVDQLINNAQAHAFIGSNQNNLLRFNIKRSKQMPVVTIEYTNNGKDFKLAFETFTSPFEKSQQSSGSGIGGYYIKRIVEAHKGTLLPNEKYKKGFALTIELPLTQNSLGDE